jgi:predicted DNA-binding ribbon-helix-helix protein
MAEGQDFSPPVKRSVTIAGHETSVALEPMFWAALERAALDSGQPLNALIARIDAERIKGARPSNLASTLRQWLFREAMRSSDDSVGEGALAMRRNVEP